MQNEEKKLNKDEMYEQLDILRKEFFTVRYAYLPGADERKNYSNEDIMELGSIIECQLGSEAFEEFKENGLVSNYWFTKLELSISDEIAEYLDDNDKIIYQNFLVALLPARTFNCSSREVPNIGTFLLVPWGLTDIIMEVSTAVFLH